MHISPLTRIISSTINLISETYNYMRRGSTYIYSTLEVLNNYSSNIALFIFFLRNKQRTQRRGKSGFNAKIVFFVLVRKNLL